MSSERRLQRRETILKGEAFNRDHFLIFGLHGEHQARAHCGAIDQHGTCAAYTVLAAHMRSCKPQSMAQAVGKRQPRLDFDLDWLAIDLKSYWHGINCAGSLHFSKRARP